MCSVCVNTALYNIFIEKKENAKGMDTIDLNVLNIYIKNIIAIFKLFC